MRASLEYSAGIRWETLVEAYRNFGDPHSNDTIHVLADGGPENKPLPLVPNLIPIKMIIAQKDILSSNSMIESVNKQIKHCYLFAQDIADYHAVNEYLKKSIPDFNFI